MKYTDPSLDSEAKAFGDQFRTVLRSGCVDKPKRVYANFAHGDEDPEDLYGGKENVERLRRLKERWDPEGMFGWYNGFGEADGSKESS
ncbi:hypothetical protein DL98DRAFT_650571 [Cadophora sp. DSE1049]|nr:hypothetical protein DL98DRAFT_650571 [Cadophora sp. DSE1049]